MKRRCTLLVASCILAAACPAGASASLGGYWPLNEPKGTAITDLSANANHGTINGATRIKDGRFARALRFDGVDDEAVIPRSASLEPQTITVETYFRGSQSPGTFVYLLSNGADQCLVPSYGLFTGPSGGLAFAVTGGTESTITLSPAAPTTVWDGAWHHAAGTFDGATARLYVDGVEVGSGTPATSPTIAYGLPTGQETWLGRFGGTCALRYAGDLDEPRIWGRAMSATEVAASVAMGSPSTSSLDASSGGDAIVYTKSFSDGFVQISTESGSGNQIIEAVRLVGLLPLTSLATCRDDLSALLNSLCDITLSNGGRTANLRVRPLLLRPTVTLRVFFTSGRTVDVTVQT